MAHAGRTLTLRVRVIDALWRNWRLLLLAGIVAVLAVVELVGLRDGEPQAVNSGTLTARATPLEHPRETSFGTRRLLAKFESGELRDHNVALEIPSWLRWPSARIGQEIELRGRLRPLTERTRYLRLRGAEAVMTVYAARLTGKSRGGAAGALDALRAVAEGALARGLRPSEAALLRGMVLGQDEGLSTEIREEFRQSGLTHLVAASGQNIVLLVAFVVPMFVLFGVRVELRVAITLALIALYVPLAGGGPSIQRAGVMGAVAALGILVGRRPLRWYALLLAAAVTMALNPHALEDVGWQLSFAAVASIFLLTAPMHRLLESWRIPNAMAELIALTAAASLGTAPLLILHFDQFSPLSMPANVLAAPAVAPIMWLGMLAALVGQLDGRLAIVINAITQFPLAYVQAVAHVTTAAIALPLPVIGAAEVKAPTVPTISFLDVGQGDATLIQDHGRTVLVDAGPPDGPILQRLRERGVRSIDLLVTTHAQADHEGGVPAVLERYPVGTLLDGAVGSSSSLHRETVRIAQAYAVRRVVPDAGQAIGVGAIRLRVLWPPAEPAGQHRGEDPNQRAIVTLLTLSPSPGSRGNHLMGPKGLRVLLTADAESDVTLPLDLPDIDVLKVAHHGSADPGLSRLLERTRPEAAVIEVGRHNSYGHPAPSTLRALRSLPRVYRTDRNGTVTITP